MLLFMVIIGGSGSHLGAIVGAVVLRLLQDVLEPFVGQFHVLGLGILMVVVILLQPKGLAGMWHALMARWRASRREGAS
jgi:ABC-type branched-subunit amino acid transport system permease subunit